MLAHHRNSFEMAKYTELSIAILSAVTHDFMSVLPHSFIELDSFKKMMQDFEPRYKIPNRATFSVLVILVLRPFNPVGYEDRPGLPPLVTS
jgi:hypothetical protein